MSDKEKTQKFIETEKNTKEKSAASSDSVAKLSELKEEINTNALTSHSIDILSEKLAIINDLRKSIKDFEKKDFEAIDYELRNTLATKLWESTNGDPSKADNSIPALADALSSEFSIEDIRAWDKGENLLTDIFTRKIGNEENAFKIELYRMKKFEIGLGLGDLIPAKYQVISNSADFRFSEDKDTGKQWQTINENPAFKDNESYRAHRMLYKGRPSYCRLNSDGSKGSYVETFTGDIIYGQPEFVIQDQAKLQEIQSFEEEQLTVYKEKKEKEATFDETFEEFTEEQSLDDKFALLQKKGSNEFTDEFDPANLDNKSLFLNLKFEEKQVLQDIWKDFGGAILKTAYRYGISPSVITSTIFCESRGKADAYNPEKQAREAAEYEKYKANWEDYKTDPMLTKDQFFGSYGLGQMRGMTAITIKPGIDINDLKDPETNIDLIGLLLKKNKSVTGNDPLLMRKAYVMGVKKVYKSYDASEFMAVNDNVSSALTHKPMLESNSHDIDDSEIYDYDEYAAQHGEKIKKESDFTGGNETNIEGHRIIKEPVEAFIFNGNEIKTKRTVYESLLRADANFNEEYSNLHIIIGSNFRSNEEQKNLPNQKTGLAAPVGHSFHELGQAFDLQLGSFNEEQIQAIEKYMRAEGFENEVPKERWHFSMGETNNLNDALELCQSHKHNDNNEAQA